MIPLQTILDQLQNGEYKLTALVDRKLDFIQPAKYNSVIVMVNAALTDIHNRFVVRNSALMLMITRDKRKYHLIGENALTVNPEGFITDTVDAPFLDDVLKITGITDLNGRPIPLNQIDQYQPDVQRWGQTRFGHTTADGYTEPSNCTLSFHTPSHNVLLTPNRLDNGHVIVNYRANAPLVKQIKPEELETVDPSEIFIHLPTAYTNAITYYVASRFSNGLGAETIGRGIFHQGNNYYQKYIAECEDLKEVGVDEEYVIDLNYSLRSKGFI